MATPDKQMIRVLLIRAIDNESEVESRYPNLGLGYLAEALRQGIPEISFDFKIIDTDIAEALRTFKPHLAGITTVSQNFQLAKNYSAIVAERGVPMLWGGVHISALPALLPKEAAAACMGEGEKTFVDLVKCFLNTGFTSAALDAIPGIAYWNAGKLTITQLRPPIRDLDSIPIPSRTLLSESARTYMFTSRGCPYKCTFCSSSRYWEKTRFFSAEYVVNEVEYLYRTFNASLIRLFDDLFIAKRARMEEMILLMEKRGLLGKVSFTCNCRANLIDDEMVALLRRIGVVSVGFGLESGDAETLNYLKCGSVSVTHNQQAVERIKKAGMGVNASFVIGSPRETRESIMNTYRFIQKSKLDFFDVYILTPFPGTPIWEYAKSRGLVSEDNFDWSVLDVNIYRNPGKAIILSETLSKDEIIRLYKMFKLLRLKRSMVRIWRHPLVRELPRYAYGRAREYATDKFRKLRILTGG